MISDATSPQVNVDIACNYSGGAYLLAWQDRYVGGEDGIWWRKASTSEALSPEFEVVEPRSAADRGYPALASGFSNFMATWEHDRDSGTIIDIHGWLLGYFEYLPLTKSHLLEEWIVDWMINNFRFAMV